jgi:GNAT superfamily N-acetyltransferase
MVSMKLTVVEDSPSRLADYAQISIGFTVRELFDEEAIAALMRRASANPTPIAAAYWKDYDSYPGGSPTDWPARFDMSHWTLLAAYLDDRRLGGAALITGDPGIDLLRDCPACALLWDLRVSPAARTRGVGSALLRAVEDHARQRSAHVLCAETQQVNVPACRFYQRHGFWLDRAIPDAYPQLPDETQLLWRKALT